LRENLNEVAGNGTGATEKRPDSMKLFERKKHDIQLKSDDFRNCCQTSPILRPGFFDGSKNPVRICRRSMCFMAVPS